MEDHTWLDGLFDCARRLAGGSRRHLVTLFDRSGTVVAEQASDHPTAADAVAAFATEAGPGTLVVATRDDPHLPEPFENVDALTLAVDALDGPVLGAWLICDEEGVDVCLPPRKAG